MLTLHARRIYFTLFDANLKQRTVNKCDSSAGSGEMHQMQYLSALTPFNGVIVTLKWQREKITPPFFIPPYPDRRF
jgi:hypothetical protein